MSRFIRIIAMGLWVLFLVVLAAAGYLGLNHPEDPITLIDALWACSFVGFPTTGMLIVMQMPRRPLGWIFLLAPLLLISGVFFAELADAPRSWWPVDRAWTAWLSNVTFSSGLVQFIFIPLLLPAGTLPSRKWRGVAGVGVVAAALWVLSAMFAPGELVEYEGITNPLGVSWLGGLFELARTLVGPTVIAVPLLGIVSLLLRPRRASGAERQQLKWIALGGATIALCVASIWVVERVFGDLSDAATTPVIIVVILAFPVSIAVAILRYRLYDIDVIINRALVYGLLTAALLAFYLLIVVALSRVLDPVTRDSDVAVAASTLVVAALFRPLRARLQGFIDRRFYRAKYNATQALNDFGSRLRDEVEFDVVRHDLLGVVAATLQPRHASVWIKPESSR